MAAVARVLPLAMAEAYCLVSMGGTDRLSLVNQEDLYM